MMSADDPDRDQVDLLVRELMTRPRVPTTATPVVSQRVDHSSPASPATAAPPAEPLADSPQGERRAGRRWSNVRILMPSTRQAERGPRMALAATLSLPQLPNLSRFVGMPGPEAIVRMWVGLGVVYCASLSFWPYPKTYLWGMVLYMLSLGLVLVSGVWGARLSWQARLGAAHTVAVGTVCWAVGLAAAETLPPR